MNLCRHITEESKNCWKASKRNRSMGQRNRGSLRSQYPTYKRRWGRSLFHLTCMHTINQWLLKAWQNIHANKNTKWQLWCQQRQRTLGEAFWKDILRIMRVEKIHKEQILKDMLRMMKLEGRHERQKNNMQCTDCKTEGYTRANCQMMICYICQVLGYSSLHKYSSNKVNYRSHLPSPRTTTKVRE